MVVVYRLVPPLLSCASMVWTDTWQEETKNALSLVRASHMETDAFLALIIALFLWQAKHVGIWILGLGLMRYLFIGASYWLPFLRAELYPSLRRKIVCVIQVGVLCLMLYPFVSTSVATLLGMVALFCLSYSFATDVLWLLRRNIEMSAHKQK